MNTTNNNTPTLGEISWDHKSFDNKDGNKSNKDLFMRLADGSNIIRIVTNPFQYLTHQGVKKVGDIGNGHKLNCSKVNGRCPLCEAGHPVSMRWFFGIIDRHSNSYKVLDASPMIYYRIKEYNEKTNVWGDPTKYDFDIVKNSKNPQSYYTVMAIPHKPLTPSEQKMRDDADLTELKRLSSALALDQMDKLFAKYVGEGPLHIPEPKSKDGVVKTAPKAVSSSVVSKVAHKVSVSAVEADDDTEFPAFEEVAGNQ